MLRVPAVIAVLGLSALTLAACASAPAGAQGSSCERNVSDATVLDFAVASGDFGKPAVKLDAPVYVKDTTFTDETVGEGLRVTSDAQDVIFSVAIANGASGQTILQSGTQVQALSKWRTDFGGLAQMMTCATEGTRVVGAVPASALSAQAAQNVGITADQAIVVVLDLQKVYLAAADGAPQYNDRRDMPSVVLAPDGRPGVIVPDAKAPTEVAVELLKKGAGATVSDKDTARVHYTAVNWDTRKVTTSTWEDGATQAVGPGSDLAFAAQVVGATVGSQLLVVVPGSGADPAATVYVVDVLGIDPAAAAQ